MNVDKRLIYQVKTQIQILVFEFSRQNIISNEFAGFLSKCKFKLIVWIFLAKLFPVKTNEFIWFYLSKSNFGNLYFSRKNPADSFEIMFWRENSFEILLTWKNVWNYVLKWKEYFPNLLESALCHQIFAFWVRDLKIWLIAYFFILLSCAKFQQGWTTFIFDIL